MQEYLIGLACGLAIALLVYAYMDYRRSLVEYEKEAKKIIYKMHVAQLERIIEKQRVMYDNMKKKEIREE